jgi:hypothetical protein
MGIFDRLKRPDREKEAWTLWPGDGYLIEVTSPEVLELARSTESPSKFVSIHSRENILEIRFEGQELGLFNSEDSKYYISVVKLLEKNNLLPRTEFSVDKKGRVSISLERANSVLPFNQEIPGVTKFLTFESVACKDENKFSAGVKHLSREGWVDPGWFLLRRTNDGIQVLSYREPKNVFHVANIPKKNEKEVQSWPFDPDGFLLVPGYIDGKYSNSTNLFASDDYSTPQITLSRYVDIR